MKLRLPRNSLFAILLRSAWWLSVFVAVGVFAVVRFFMEWGYALFATAPFLVIAAIAAWKQIRVPGGARLARSLDRIRGLTWEAFAAALEEGFRREGYKVKRVEGAADFELDRAGRLALVGARRWKASRTGVEPLKELLAAAHKREAAECVYVCAGDMTEQARAVAKDKGVRLVEGVELVRLVRNV